MLKFYILSILYWKYRQKYISKFHRNKNEGDDKIEVKDKSAASIQKNV